MRSVAVIGAGYCDETTASLAEQAGRGLAEAGFILVCGGLGGVMEAACRGAKRAGGVTIGILPGADAGEANPWVDFPIVTGLGEARNSVVVRTSRAVVAIGGEFGTLSEIAFALKFGIPVVGIGTWRLVSERELPGGIVYVESAGEAVSQVKAWVRQGR